MNKHNEGLAMYIFSEDTLSPRLYKVFDLDAGGNTKREQKQVDKLVNALDGKNWANCIRAPPSKQCALWGWGGGVMCGQRRPRSDCGDVQSDQGFQCSLTEASILHNVYMESKARMIVCTCA